MLQGIAPLLIFLSSCASTPPKDELYDVDVTLTNPHARELTNQPVFLQVFRIFGRGVDYGKFRRDGFHVYDEKGEEVEFSVRSLPPSFSLGDDEIILTLPTLAPGAKAKFRFTNTPEKSRKEAKFDVARLIDHPNNLIPNGGFEKGADGWQGGKVVSDVVRSGKNALLLEVPGSGGAAELHCTKPVPFVKGMNYYFGIWAKCENVTRRTWRYTQPWAAQQISGRITFSADPLRFPEFSE
jgi:hypothetical protein